MGIHWKQQQTIELRKKSVEDCRIRGNLEYLRAINQKKPNVQV